MATDIFGGLATVFAAILGALIAFVLLQTLGERLKRRRLKRLSFQALIHEFDQNQQHQAFSSIISLDDEAYRQFKRRGFLAELEETFQHDLMHLYSRIHEKNQLLLYFQSALSAGKSSSSLLVGGEQTPMPITVLLEKIKVEIDQKINELLPRLVDAFEDAMDP